MGGQCLNDRALTGQSACAHAERQSGPTPNWRRTRRPCTTKLGPHSGACNRGQHRYGRCAPTLSISRMQLGGPYAHSLPWCISNTRRPNSNSPRTGREACGQAQQHDRGTVSQLRLSALMVLYIHPLYVLVSKILSSMFNSPAPIHPLYHPLSTLSTVGPTCHFI
jgi:hypothetical protein